MQISKGTAMNKEKITAAMQIVSLSLKHGLTIPKEVLVTSRSIEIVHINETKNGNEKERYVRTKFNTSWLALSAMFKRIHGISVSAVSMNNQRDREIRDNAKKMGLSDDDVLILLGKKK